MKKFYNHKIVINKEQNLQRLDQALAKLSDSTRSQIKILINKGNILKDGEVFKVYIDKDSTEVGAYFKKALKMLED